MASNAIASTLSFKIIVVTVALSVLVPLAFADCATCCKTQTCDTSDPNVKLSCCGVARVMQTTYHCCLTPATRCFQPNPGLMIWRCENSTSALPGNPFGGGAGDGNTDAGSGASGGNSTSSGEGGFKTWFLAWIIPLVLIGVAVLAITAHCAIQRHQFKRRIIELSPEALREWSERHHDGRLPPPIGSARLGHQHRHLVFEDPTSSPHLSMGSGSDEIVRSSSMEYLPPAAPAGGARAAGGPAGGPAGGGGGVGEVGGGASSGQGFL